MRRKRSALLTLLIAGLTLAAACQTATSTPTPTSTTPAQTSEEPGAATGIWDSSTLSTGGTFSFTLNEGDHHRHRRG